MAFLRMGTVQRWGGHQLNLLHYEDAASLCLAVCLSVLMLGSAS